MKDLLFCVALALATASASPLPSFSSPLISDFNLQREQLAHREPISRVSVNIVDLLWNYVGTTPNNASHSREILTTACARGFTFVRFAAVAYWPLRMHNAYYANTTAWWSSMDQLLADAAAAQCQLMPSLFWNTFIFSDLAGEPFQALLQENSTSRKLLFDFVRETVRHLSSSPVVVAWELWNELNLLVDMNMDGSTNACYPPLGTPAARTLADNASTADLMALQRDMAAVIRAEDPLHRPISSGNSIPRVDAEHLRASYYAPHRDTRADSRVEFARNLADVNQFCDWISIHMYSSGDNMRWNYTDPLGATLLREVAPMAASLRKPLYLGEFGDAAPGPRTYSHNVLSVLAEPTVARAMPVSTVWIWQFFQSSPTVPSDYSLVPGRDDAFIETMRAFNARGEE